LFAPDVHTVVSSSAAIAVSSLSHRHRHSRHRHHLQLVAQFIVVLVASFLFISLYRSTADRDKQGAPKLAPKDLAILKEGYILAFT